MKIPDILLEISIKISEFRCLYQSISCVLIFVDTMMNFRFPASASSDEKLSGESSFRKLMLL